MSRRDEKQQAEITKIQAGGNAWVSTNDARRASGQEPLKLKIADEVLVKTKGGPVPLSALEEQYFGKGAGKPAAGEGEDSRREEPGDKAEEEADDAGSE